MFLDVTSEGLFLESMATVTGNQDISTKAGDQEGRPRLGTALIQN